MSTLNIYYDFCFALFRKLTSFTTPSTTVLPISAINKETEITIPQDKHYESKI